MKIILKSRFPGKQTTCIKCDRKLSQNTRIKINDVSYFIGAWCSKCNIAFTLKNFWRCCLLSETNQICQGLLRSFDLSCESASSHNKCKGKFKTIYNQSNRRTIQFL